MHLNLHLFCVFSLISVAFGGVKIEITRIKEPPKPITEDTRTTATIDSTTQTPMSTTLSTTTTTQSAVSTTSTPSQIQNINLSTTTATTIAPIAGTGMTNVRITNDISPTLVPQMNFPLLYNFTMAQSPRVPVLNELTRRQMRRKMIPFDYYCPCDLKVFNPSIVAL